MDRDRAWSHPRPRPSRARRAPAALVAALGILLAAPLLAARVPDQQILGVASVASPSGAAPAGSATPGIARAPERVVLRPDPAGERSVPSVLQAPPVDSLTGYRWPVRNATLTLPFGPSKFGTMIVKGALFHDGIDLATWCGDPIRAAHGGTVLAAGRHFDAYVGWVGDLTAYTDRLTAKGLWPSLPIVIVIDDGNGYRSIYAHLRYVAVKPGDVVAAGDYIGNEGDTGRASGCHLHYGLFSPYAASTFALEPVAAAHMLLPPSELARIDPLLVLPPQADAGIH